MDVKKTALSQCTTDIAAADHPPVSVFHQKKITENNSFVRTALTGLGLINDPNSASPINQPPAIRRAVVSAHKRDDNAKQALKAVRERNVAALEILLKNNTINVNYRDPETGDTAWGLALRAGDQEMISLLKPALATASLPITRRWSESKSAREIGEAENHRSTAISPVIPEAPSPLVKAAPPHENDTARVGEKPDLNGVNSTFESDPWTSLPEKYRSATGVFDAIAAGDQSALKLWLASNKFKIGAPHPETGLTPLLHALTLGKHDMVDDLVSAGANPDGINLKSDDAIQSLALSYVPQAYRSHEGMMKAAQEGKTDICVNLHLSGILQNTAVSNYSYSPITPRDVEGHKFFHTRYIDTKNQILLLHSGMYFFRKSSQGGFAISHKDNRNQIKSTRFDCRDGKIITESRGKTQTYDTFDDFLIAIMPFTYEPQGVDNPWSKLDALDQTYLKKGGLLAAVAHGNTDAIETMIMCGMGEYEIDHISVNGKTALTFAIETRNNDLARRLIRAGADPRAADAQKNTPMHIAAKNNDSDMIDFLIENEASTETENSAGLKPRQLATAEAVISRLTRAVHDSREQGSDED